MGTLRKFIFPSLLIHLLLCTIESLEYVCSREDEDCFDRQMHPDLVRQGEELERSINPLEYTNNYWLNLSREFIKQQMNRQPNTSKAKNIIFFLGDGMGLTTVAAARNLLGGTEQKLAFEEFPYSGLSKTYSVDRIVSDSACTATAYLCGVKAIKGTIGVNGQVNMGDCAAGIDRNNFVESIAKWAMDAGKSAGVVTTTRVTHASPAGVYANIADRDWENDSKVKEACGTKSAKIEDIAYQLMHGEVGRKLSFIMGGGKQNFIDSSLYGNGKRSDGLDLIEYFQQEHPDNVYVETRNELMQVNLSEANRVLGLYQDSHMLCHLETDENTNQPTLEEMTIKAIEHLQHNENGYFVFIEGGLIDWLHHFNKPRLALDETIEFSKAIQAARQITSEEDTLIVVTADHSHAFSYGGYPQRKSDVFAPAPVSGKDGKPYMPLNYANGPSFSKFFDTESGQRVDPSLNIVGNTDDEFPSTWPMQWETHGGDDVPVYASGPWSHLFTGVYEQNALPHFMAYAACLGNGLTMCKT
uniref:Alkaline phosphatase n=1 Tax=Glossina morsitans morsitans TaxID=37546 RepID=A0A1B0G9D9_GLOMM